MPATYEPIQTSSFSGVTSVQFTSIPATYTDLVLVINSLAYFGSATYVTGGIRVGASNTLDTSSIYHDVYIYSDGVTANSGASTSGSDTSLKYIDIPATPTDAGVRGTLICNFFNYAQTSTFKSVLMQSSALNVTNNTNSTRIFVGTYKSTNALNTIEFRNFDATNFYSSTATLYGIKAA